MNLRTPTYIVLASRCIILAAAKYFRGNINSGKGSARTGRSLQEGRNKRNRQHHAPTVVLDQDEVVQTLDDEKGYLRSPRIIGGRPASEGQFPFIVSLQDRLGHFCGGSLISKDAVLTAAHCLGGSYDVVLGKNNLSAGGGQEIEMMREIEHPRYDRETTDNDFAILILGEPVDTKGKNVELVSLNREPNFPRAGDDVQVAGWGVTNSGLSSKLMEVTVEVISNQDCDDSEGYIEGFSDNYNDQITSNMLCAKESGKDSCQGDSGGPLVTVTKGAPTQVGVVSWGIGCAHRDFPGVYARVSEAYDWIEKTVCKHSKHPADSFKCRGSGGSGNDDGGNNGNGGTWDWGSNNGNDGDASPSPSPSATTNNDDGGNDDYGLGTWDWESINGDDGDVSPSPSATTGSDDGGNDDYGWGTWDWESINGDDGDVSPSPSATTRNDDGGNDDYGWGTWDWDNDDGDVTPAPVPAPSGGGGAWETIFEEDFLDGYGRFDRGSGARHYSEAKDRRGVVSIQDSGEKNSVRADSIDVGPYSRCRASLDFLFLHMEEDDELIAEVGRDGGEYTPEHVFSGYPHKEWNDDEEVEFRVDGADEVSFRLRCNGDSRKDDVYISAVKLRCKK